MTISSTGILAPERVPGRPLSACSLETQRVRATAGLTAVSPQEITSRSATNHADAV